MLKLSKKILQIVIPPLIGVFFIYLSFYYTNEEERNEIYKSLKDAKIKYILLSIFLGISSHLSRAYRWNYMLNSLGYYPKFVNNVLSIFISYLANLGIPRSGEILRATVMQTYESIPFDKGLGTILAERLIDLIILFFLIFLFLFLETDILLPVIKEKAGLYLNNYNLFLTVLFFLLSTLILIKVFKKGLVKKFYGFIKGVSAGFTSILKMQNRIYYIAHTIFIWSIYLLVFYVMKFSISGTELLDFKSLLISFIFGAISITTTNGGIGVYPLSISMALSFYGLPLETSLAFGWILWTSQTIIVIIFGLVSFVLLPIINNKIHKSHSI